MKKHIILIFTTLAVTTACFAQDYTFSQFYALPLMRNPALGGVFTGDFTAQSVYRNQWATVTTPFRTGALDVELKSYSQNTTFGVLATYDVAGDSKLKRVKGLFSVSRHKKIFGGFLLTGALMGGLVSSNFDVSALQFDDQYVNGRYSPNNATSQVLGSTSRTYIDGSTGLSISTPEDLAPTGYIGVALFHFLPYKAYFMNDSAASNCQIMLNGGLTAEIVDGFRLSGYTDYICQRHHHQFLIGGYATWDLESTNFEKTVSLSVGGMLRWNDAVIPVIQLEWYQWNIGLSYDVNISKLSTASKARGGIELTLGIRGLFYDDCPRPERWGKLRPRRPGF